MDIIVDRICNARDKEQHRHDQYLPMGSQRITDPDESRAVPTNAISPGRELEEV